MPKLILPKLYALGAPVKHRATFDTLYLKKTITTAQLRKNKFGVPKGAFGMRTLYSLGRWPAVFSGGRECIVVIEVIANALIAEGFGPLERWKVAFTVIEGGAIANKVEPSYVALRPTRFLKMKNDWNEDKPYLVVQYGEPAEPIPDDVDFFLDDGLYGWGVMCSFRVMQFIRKMKWKDFSVWPADFPKKLRGYTAWEKGANIFGKVWPPVWYPEGMGPSKYNQTPV